MTSLSVMTQTTPFKFSVKHVEIPKALYGHGFYLHTSFYGTDCLNFENLLLPQSCPCHNCFQFDKGNNDLSVSHVYTESRDVFTITAPFYKLTIMTHCSRGHGDEKPAQRSRKFLAVNKVVPGLPLCLISVVRF